MRISDWSSDVCSSDLPRSRHGSGGNRRVPACAPVSWQPGLIAASGAAMRDDDLREAAPRPAAEGVPDAEPHGDGEAQARSSLADDKIGRESWRARGVPYGDI